MTTIYSIFNNAIHCTQLYVIFIVCILSASEWIASIFMALYKNVLIIISIMFINMLTLLACTQSVYKFDNMYNESM